MRTQSIDTPPEIECIQIEIMRGFSLARKLELAADWMNFLTSANQIYQRGPEQRIAAAYGKDWQKRYQRFVRHHPQVQPYSAHDAVQRALLAAVEPLERRRIPYGITGRFACSIYGLHSATTSIEIIVEHPRHLILSPTHTRHHDAYLDVVHLIRIDVTRTTLSLSQIIPQVLIVGHPPIMMLTPEAVTLDLLGKFAATGKRDDALYNDILGMVKVQAPNMSMALLATQTTDYPLMNQLLDDAGVER
ncbi:MAG: hypothetical protein H0X24_21005 [Ktedonobacterales bacterium]|nr:hypothetical protein [Ktedonobacterales bacterium]